jgi:cbb3-type cytochrome oxidase subunit 3
MRELVRQFFDVTLTVVMTIWFYALLTWSVLTILE